MTEGSLTFTVAQLGQPVQGAFADWQADITFDTQPADGRPGRVEVTIATPSVTLGSVTPQVQGAGFLDTAAHPQARFQAEILPDGAAWVARGTLTLRGVTVPVDLPFTLTLTGDRAQMQGRTTLDRRDFAIGASYGDEATVGFAVTVAVDLIATRG
ncbi:MAG: YceI family protein [Rhodobacterales bacterium]|nr:YceI family protein [Rhodobacterales bacterium]